MKRKVKVQESHERRRGCGWRRPGLYLEGGWGAPGGRLPKFVMTAIAVDEEDDPPFRGYRYVDGDTLLGLRTGGDPVGEERAEEAQDKASQYLDLMEGIIQPGDVWHADVNWLLFRLTPQTCWQAFEQVWGRVSRRVESELGKRENG